MLDDREEARRTKDRASDDFTDVEKWEEEIEGSTLGPEERILHVGEPLTEMLDDEADVLEDSLDQQQGDDLEWRIDAADEADDETKE